MKGRTIAAWCLASMVAACAGGFKVEKLSPGTHSATQEVAWLTAEPNRPYTVIAKFAGRENGLCQTSQPYCSLYEQAREEGADAIWVQRRDVWVRQEEWVMIQGQMKRIPPERYERLEGVLIRYR